MAIEIQTVWFIFFCVVVGIAEFLWISKIHKEYRAINRRLAKIDAEEDDFWSRWNWEPTPEEWARLQVQCEESKRLIDEYWKRQTALEKAMKEGGIKA